MNYFSIYHFQSIFVLSRNFHFAIINNDKYLLTSEDFAPSIFHKRLFQAISNLAKHGAKSIECIDIYRIAEKNTSVKELFDGNNLKDFISTIEQFRKEVEHTTALSIKNIEIVLVNDDDIIKFKIS